MAWIDGQLRPLKWIIKNESQVQQNQGKGSGRARAFIATQNGVRSKGFDTPQ